MILLGVPSITSYEIALFFSVVAIALGTTICIIWFTLKFFNVSDFAYTRITKISVVVLTFGVATIWLITSINYVVNWYNHSPTNVTNNRLQGLYEIDTLYFRGENANWQHSHYKLAIGDDSLKLIILNNDQVIKEFRRKIFNVKINNMSFFEFYDNYLSDYYIKNKPKEFYHSKEDSLVQSERIFRIVNDSSNHHMLRVNPSLLLKPHNFRVIIYSTMYKNMFFKKID